MGKVKKSKKTTKSKAKGKKELQIVPRLRLEPRLTPKPTKKIQDKQEAEDGSRVLKVNEIGENSSLVTLVCDCSGEMRNYYEQEHEASCTLNNSLVNEASKNCETSTKDIQPLLDGTDEEEDWENVRVQKPRKKCETSTKDTQPSMDGTVEEEDRENVTVKKRRKKFKTSTEDTQPSIVGIDEEEDWENVRVKKPRKKRETSTKDIQPSIDGTNEEEDCENVRVKEPVKNCETSTENTQPSIDGTDEEEDWENVKVKKPRKTLVQRSMFWNDKELMNLAIGLQNEGFADLKKVASYIKTKNENEINVYLKKRCVEARKAEQPSTSRGRPNTWNTTSPENLATWPNVRKWRKLAYEQMLSLIRSKDYSKPIISSLCKKFYEEEKEPTDPQVINVKMIYKYIMDCMSGEIPAQLPPKESALVLDMLREVRLMPLACDFEEELQFLKGFKEATKFRPFQVKDEFKKRFKKAHDDEALGPNTVSVPEEVFMDLSRHKKLVQSLNPLVTPLWMLQKEQETLEKYFKESNVYVD